MATFPKLKTGAVLQYPAERSMEYSTEVLEFADGTEQRYRDGGSALHRWVIRLELLNEQEMSALASFCNQQQGRFGSFPFQDPWDGAEYPNCSLEDDVFTEEWLGEARGRTVLVVRENRL
jgi:hypothetical protein